MHSRMMCTFLRCQSLPVVKTPKKLTMHSRCSCLSKRISRSIRRSSAALSLGGSIRFTPYCLAPKRTAYTQPLAPWPSFRSSSQWAGSKAACTSRLCPGRKSSAACAAPALGTGCGAPAPGTCGFTVSTCSWLLPQAAKPPAPRAPAAVTCDGGPCPRRQRTHSEQTQ